MDYLLTQEEIYNTIHKIPMSKYAIILTSTKNEYQYNHQVKIMERHALLEAQLEKVQGMIADMEAWYDQALDWRELEVKRAQNRISELETEIAKFSPDKVRNILKKYLPETYFEGSFIERITNEICEE